MHVLAITSAAILSLTGTQQWLLKLANDSTSSPNDFVNPNRFHKPVNFAQAFGEIFGRKPNRGTPTAPGEDSQSDERKPNGRFNNYPLRCDTIRVTKDFEGFRETIVQIEILPHHVNDGYCDCTYDGADEVGTGACSGIARSDEKNYFQCPHGTKSIPPSRVKDGICDCCDGSDENSNYLNCEDKCSKLLKDLQFARDEKMRYYEKGAVKLKSSYEEFATKVPNVNKLLEDIDMQISNANTDLDEVAVSRKEIEMEIAIEKRDKIVKVVEKVSNEIGLVSMSTDELVTFISLIIELSGGTGKSSFDSVLERASNDLSLDYAWAKDDPSGDSGDSHDDLDDECNDDEKIGSDLIEDEAVAFEEIDHTDEGLEKISEKDSSLRLAFKKNAEHFTRVLRNFIGNSFDISDCSNQNENIDPKCNIADIKSELEKLHKKVLEDEDKGLKARKSIFSFIDFCRDRGDTPEKILKSLENIAVLILWYARVGAADVMDILEEALPEYRDRNTKDPHDYAYSNTCMTIADETPEALVETAVTCGTDWFSRIVKNVEIDIPSSNIILHADKRCNQRSSDLSKIFESYPSMTCVPVESIIVPSSIYDGFSGYYQFSPANSSDDILINMLEPLSAISDSPPNKKLELIDKFFVDHEAKISKLHSTKENLEKQIGGKDKIYGDNGELYILKDLCLDIDSGSYNYELCFFGKASQRDKGKTTGGTGIGKWNNILIEKGKKVPQLKFSNGDKCWNGPKRSALVDVTCGPDHILLSADEAETCVYHFVMKSPLGCTEEFALEEGLID